MPSPELQREKRHSARCIAALNKIKYLLVRKNKKTDSTLEAKSVFHMSSQATTTCNLVFVQFNTRR